MVVSFPDRPSPSPSSAPRQDVAACAPAAVHCVAVVPARGGSKGVPGKNRRLVGGVPLVMRAVRSCRAAAAIDLTVVSTDDPETAALARAAGAVVVERPPDLAGDTASSESAVLHAIGELATLGIRPDVVFLVQCTSPFIDPADLDRAAALVVARRADSVFSAVESYGFVWRDASPTQEPGSGPLIGQNHNAASRPRRQDRRPDFVETGAFYAMRTDGLLAAGHRFFGRTMMVSVSPATAVEIDTPEELALADALAAHLPDPPGEPAAPQQPGEAIDADAVITDFDGVHTDDTAGVDEFGVESVRVSRSDGMGVARLRRAGVPVVIISTEANPVVAARGAKLGVDVIHGVEDKATAVREWVARHGLDLARTAYVGNDVNDAAAMALVGWPVAVADAQPAIRQMARVVLERRGGAGAVREVCERVLAARPEATTAPIRLGVVSPAPIDGAEEPVPARSA